jgi:hypothetical protein
MQHLNQTELAERWDMSPRTLEQWRWRGVGPVFLKIGRHVVYRMVDVEAYEAERLHANTIAPLAISSDRQLPDEAL